MKALAIFLPLVALTASCDMEMQVGLVTGSAEFEIDSQSAFAEADQRPTTGEFQALFCGCFCGDNDCRPASVGLCARATAPEKRAMDLLGSQNTVFAALTIGAVAVLGCAKTPLNALRPTLSIVASAAMTYAAVGLKAAQPIPKTVHPNAARMRLQSWTNLQPSGDL